MTCRYGFFWENDQKTTVLEQERAHRPGSSTAARVVNTDDGDEKAAEVKHEKVTCIERMAKQARLQKTRRKEKWKHRRSLKIKRAEEDTKS